MPRIRSIKPEFPQSESIGRLSRDARLLFVQLWTIVDDEGRTRAASRMLASLLYPYDDDAPALIEQWLAELERENCIRRYSVDGKTYLDIPHWDEHQKIDHKSRSKLPPYPECRDDSPKPREVSREFPSDSRTLAPDLDLGSGPSSSLSPFSATTYDDEETQREQACGRKWSFNEFWDRYPHKVGKKAAQSAFERVRKAKNIDFTELIAGLERYSAKTDDRPWCNPATWLNQGRWEDQPAETPLKNGATHVRTVQDAARDLHRRVVDRIAEFGLPNGPSDEAGGAAARLLPKG